MLDRDFVMEAVAERDQLVRWYMQVRQQTEVLAAPLSAEDQNVQSMPDASPTKWHLAHTTWFFEVFVLMPFLSGYECFRPVFHYLFNSYYEGMGRRHPRHSRGMLSRPSLEDVMAFRQHVDKGMIDLLVDGSPDCWPAIHELVELGLHHEQQHQELILTDILHAFSCNPLLPAYQKAPSRSTVSPNNNTMPEVSRWASFAEGVFTVGNDGAGFSFDNERPMHPVILQPFELATHLVTCGEYLQFIEDDGYRRPEFWLSDGWSEVQSQQWCAPMYWLAPGDFRAPAADWQWFSLAGVETLPLNRAVTHLSFYEACAYAQWVGARLPTEFEWEVAASRHDVRQVNGIAWQWTRSSYGPYPGFRPLRGVAGEYNGKFMVGQQVLRGSSHATPVGHARLTYRNYFPPATRWQFSGIRLARG